MSDFTDGDATRVLQAIEERVRRRMKNGAFVHTTWGRIADIELGGKASAYLYDELALESVASEDFRLPPAMSLPIGAAVKVAIDYQRGERWIEDVEVGTDYPKIAIDPVTGVIKMGPGDVEPPATLEVVDELHFGISGGGLYIRRASPTNPALLIGPDGQVNNMPFAILADGKVTWGDGVGARDTNLYRSAANQLKTDDDLYVAGGNLLLGAQAKFVENSTARPMVVSTGATEPRFGVELSNGHATTSSGVFVWNNGDSVPRASIGKTTGGLPGLFLGDGASASDINLYRSSSGLLKLGSSTTSGPGRLMIGDSDNGADLSTTELYIGTERPWHFIQGLSGASTELWLQPIVAGKRFNIVANDNTPIFGVLASDAGVKAAIVHGADAVEQKGSTAFPPSPSNGDIYFRTDLDMEFFYNGTRWLSTTLFQHQYGVGWSNIAATDANGTDQTRTLSPQLRGGSDIWIEDMVATFHVTAGTALSASHKWDVTCSFLTSAGGVTTRATLSINSGSSAVWRNQVTTVDALMNNGTTHWFAYSTATKTGTPGNLYCYHGFTYRIVAT